MTELYVLKRKFLQLYLLGINKRDDFESDSVYRNKKDLHAQREVEWHEAVEFAKKRNIPLFETSAKFKTNMENVFQTIAWEFVNQGSVMESSVAKKKCCVQ